MILTQSINQYLREQEREQANKQYVQSQAYALVLFADFCEVNETADLTPAVVKRALDNTRKSDGTRFSRASKGSFVRVWKLYLDWLYKNKLTVQSLRDALPYIATWSSSDKRPKPEHLNRILATLHDYINEPRKNESYEIVALRNGVIFSIIYCSGCRSKAVRYLELNEVVRALANPLENGLYSMTSECKGSKAVLVLINEATAELIRRWLKVRPPSDSPYLLVTGNNGQLSQSTIKAAFIRICAYAGVPIYCPHSWRHLFVSTLNDQGVDLKTMSFLAGHSSEQTTLRHYVHITKERALDEAARVMAARVGDLMANSVKAGE